MKIYLNLRTSKQEFIDIINQCKIKMMLINIILYHYINK